ncbi:cilia- and flagella-associated protein 251-like [Clavelina lepadiformis]|uniref:cilia- and flagella-associated protein 251-like n=1 Tax=Clavelina lepadiformis TaxID=159417 RepID=UPI00404176DA
MAENGDIEQQTQTSIPPTPVEGALANQNEINETATLEEIDHLPEKKPSSPQNANTEDATEKSQEPKTEADSKESVGSKQTDELQPDERAEDVQHDEAQNEQNENEKLPPEETEQDNALDLKDTGRVPQEDDVESKKASPSPPPGTPEEKPGTPIESQDAVASTPPAAVSQADEGKAAVSEEKGDSGEANLKDDESKPTVVEDQKMASTPLPSAGITDDLPAQPESPKPQTPVGTAESEKQKKSQSSEHGEIPRPPSVPEESNVTKAIAEDSLLQPDEANQPLNLEWTFGLNRRVPCINLTDDHRSLILYAASHLAVLYDYKNNKQKILQGHGNAITCMVCSEDKRWIATGDKGPKSCVIVWDSYTGIPVQTIFDLPGIVALGMSEDAKYIVSITSASPQMVSIWDWTNTSEEPMFSVTLDSTYGQQTYIKFHPQNNQVFATNSETQVIFYSSASGQLKYDAPYLSDTVFNRGVGLYSQTIFQTEPSKRALTATSLGNIVVWNPERPNVKNGGVVADYKKRALKLVRVKDRGLTALSQTENFVVTGDMAGHVTFYDDQLNLINWYRDFRLGPINGITFKYSPEFVSGLSPNGKNYPDDATIQARTFVVRDFVVSTKSAEITHVEADGTLVTPVQKEHDAAVHALAACPTKAWLCIGSYAGLLKIWNYETKKVLVTRVFENRSRIQCMSFSHDGLQMAIGMTSGAVHIVDSISLNDEICFHYARDAITHCTFSHNSKYLATADGQYITTVFVQDKNSEWKYLGRYRAHYEPIQDLKFGVDLDSNLPRLLSLGKDRVLVEYDLNTSTKDDLRLRSVDRIEQSAVPLCFAWYPPVTKESFLVAANDQYKMKLYNTTTKMCRRTLLGPTYGSPAKRMLVVPPEPGADPSVDRMLCYATNNKIGLQLLPLDGNPHRSVSFIAHPDGVSRLVCSNDGRYVFTAGGKEATVHMWSVNRTSLEAVAALGGEDLIPFYGLLDGGREGEMFAELENYFYYAQLRSQGINTTEEREVSTVVPLDQVPFLMRALGFYPSEQEVEDMLNEVKFSQYVETGQYVTEIDLSDFIKLYINHRPAYGLSPDELYKAFEVLGSVKSDGEPAIDRSDLLSILQRKGEHMTEYELAEYLTTLLGYCAEGGSAELGETRDHEEASKDLEEVLPDYITANQFASDILGLNLYE